MLVQNGKNSPFVLDLYVCRAEENRNISWDQVKQILGQCIYKREKTVYVNPRTYVVLDLCVRKAEESKFLTILIHLYNTNGYST